MDPSPVIVLLFIRAAVTVIVKVLPIAVTTFPNAPTNSPSPSKLPVIVPSGLTLLKSAVRLLCILVMCTEPPPLTSIASKIEPSVVIVKPLPTTIAIDPRFPVNVSVALKYAVFVPETKTFEKSPTRLLCKSDISIFPVPWKLLPDAFDDVVIKVAPEDIVTVVVPKNPLNVVSEATLATILAVVVMFLRSAEGAKCNAFNVVDPAPLTKTPSNKEAAAVKLQTLSTMKLEVPMVTPSRVIVFDPDTVTIDLPREPVNVLVPANDANTFVVSKEVRSASRVECNAVTVVSPAPLDANPVSKEAGADKLEPLSTTKLEVPMVTPSRVIVFDPVTNTIDLPREPVNVLVPANSATTFVVSKEVRSASRVECNAATVVTPAPFVTIPDNIDASIIKLEPDNIVKLGVPIEPEGRIVTSIPEFKVMDNGPKLPVNIREFAITDVAIAVVILEKSPSSLYPSLCTDTEPLPLMNFPESCDA